MKMKNYCKKDLIDSVSEKTGHTSDEVQVILEEMLNSIAISLQQQNKVEIRGFGSFTVRLKKGDESTIPEGKPNFKFSPQIISRMNN